MSVRPPWLAVNATTSSGALLVVLFVHHPRMCRRRRHVPQWIQACVVQRVSLRDGLVLDFDDCNEVVIYRPLRLTLPAVGDFPVEAVFIDPGRVATHERPLLDLAGAVCTQAWCGDGGGLHLGFPADTASMLTPTRRSPPGSCTAGTTATWRACRMGGSGWSAMTSPRPTTPR